MRFRPPRSFHSTFPPYGSSRPGWLRRMLPRVLPALAATLGVLWAAPLTLMGLLLALPVVCWHGRIRLVDGPTPALLVSGPWADHMLAHHPFGAMIAMAIGHVVFEERSGLSKRILSHELEHVRQAAAWGPLFPFAYIGASMWARLHGRDAYFHNVFEVAARRAEQHL
ncbi:MAG: signal peptide prediction [Janthinobacterium lividum]